MAPLTGAAPTASATVRSRRPLFYYGYWLVGVALIAQFVAVGMQVWVSGVFLKPMTEELGWTRAEFTYAQTVGPFLMVFVALFVGVYLDRYGGRVLMVLGVTVIGASLMLTSAVTELWQWVLVRGAMFAAGGALLGNLVVIVTLSKWFVEKRGRVIGIAAMGSSLAGLTLPPLLTAFTDEFGWRAGWRALAITAWLLIYPLAMFMRRRPEDHGLHPDGRSDEEIAAGQGEAAAADYAGSLTRREALRTPALYLIVFAFGLSGLTMLTVILQTIPYLTDEGFSRGTAALMVTVLAIPQASTKPVWGLLVDRMGPRVLASVSLATAAVSQLLLVMGVMAGSLPVVVASYVIMGAASGGMGPIQEVFWASYFGRRYLGAVRSIAMPFSLIIGTGGPLAVALYFDIVGNYHGAFFVLSGLSVLAALIILLVRRPRARSAVAGPGAPAPTPPPDGVAPSSGDGASPAQAPEADAEPAPPRLPARDYMSVAGDGAPTRARVD